MSQSLTIKYTNTSCVASQKIVRCLSLNFGPILSTEAKPLCGKVTFRSFESARKALQAGFINIEGKRVTFEPDSPVAEKPNSRWNRYEDDDVVEITPSRKADEVPSEMQNYGGRPFDPYQPPPGSSGGRKGTVTRTMYAVYADNLPTSARDPEVKDYFRRFGAERVEPLDTASDGTKMVKVFFGLEEDAQRLLDARVMNFQGRQIFLRSHPKASSPAVATPKAPLFTPPSPRGSNPYGPSSSRGSNPYGPGSRDTVVQGRGGKMQLEDVLKDDAFKAMESLVSTLSKPPPGMGGRNEDTANNGRGGWDRGGRRRSREREMDMERGMGRPSAEENELVRTLREQLRQQKEIVEQQLTFQKEQRAFIDDLKTKLDKAETERSQLRRELDAAKEEKFKLERNLDRGEIDKAKLKHELSQAKAEVDKLSKENKKLTGDLQASTAEVQKLTKLWNDAKKENEEHKAGLLNFRRELENLAETQSRSSRIDRDRSPPGHRRKEGPPPQQMMSDDPRGAKPDEPNGDLLRTIEELSNLRDALMEDPMYPSARVDIDEPRVPPYGGGDRGRNVYSPPRQRRGMSPPSNVRRDFPRHGTEGDGEGGRGGPREEREREGYGGRGRGFNKRPPPVRSSLMGRPPQMKYRRN